MEILEHLERRRSVRRYGKGKVSEDDLKKVLYAGRVAPSAWNRQPWKFYVVREREKIEELSRIHRYAGFAKEAPVVIVVTVDQSLSPNHYVEDEACAAMNMWICASNIGLGSCWIAVYSEDQRYERKVREILGIPERYRVICLLPPGFPGRSLGPRH